MKINATVTGGKKLFAHSRKMKTTPPHTVDVGFFETARYPPIKTGKDTRKNREKPRKQEPHPVAFIAAIHEFGSRRHPERPFFRLAIKQSAEQVSKIIEAATEPDTAGMSRRGAGLVGNHVAGQITKSIVKFDDPPNTQATIEIKGSSNVLVDTGTLKNSPTFKVNRAGVKS